MDACGVEPCHNLADLLGGPDQLGVGSGERRLALGGCGWAVAHVHQQGGRTLDVRRIPAYGLTGAVQHGHLLDQLLRTAPGVPLVGEAGGGGEGAPLAGATDHERESPHRLGRQRRTVELVVAAGEVGPLVGDHALDDLAGLLEAVRPLARGAVTDAVAPVLVLLPGGTEAQHEPPAGYPVDGGGHLGGDRGVAVGVARHEMSQPDPGNGGGQGGEHHPGLVHIGQFGLAVRIAGLHGIALGRRHEVVGCPDAVPAGRLGDLADVLHVAEGVARVEPESEAHGRIMTRAGRRRLRRLGRRRCRVPSAAKYFRLDRR